MQAMCCVRVLPLLAPVVVPVHGIALHAGGTGAAAAIGLEQMMLCCCSVTTIMVGCKYVFFIAMSSLLLNDCLFAIVDIDAALSRLAVELATIERVPSLTPGPSPKGEGSSYTCCHIVSEVNVERRDEGRSLCVAAAYKARWAPREAPFCG